VARPKKETDDKRDQRLTVYLSEQEQTSLRDVSEQQQRSMTQIVSEALRDWLLRLMEPPESLRKARYEKIMEEKSLMARGYICRHGHTFWIDWVEPKPPMYCPMCGSQQDMKSIWGGNVKRGI